jgi:hypothetical protein
MLSLPSINCRDGKPHKLFSKKKGMQPDSDDPYLANLNIHSISINEIAMADTISKVHDADFEDQIMSEDNGGRRIGVDRRNFSYSLHIPERRSRDDRRAEVNRRKTNRIKAKSPFIS